MTLPDWMPLDAWEGYVAMRKAMKKPLTDRAKAMAVKQLEALMYQGNDPRQVLEQSEFKCWLGLFAVKQDARYNPQSQPQRMSALDRLHDTSWLDAH